MLCENFRFKILRNSTKCPQMEKPVTPCPPKYKSKRDALIWLKENRKTKKKNKQIVRSLNLAFSSSFCAHSILKSRAYTRRETSDLPMFFAKNFCSDCQRRLYFFITIACSFSLALPTFILHMCVCVCVCRYVFRFCFFYLGLWLLCLYLLYHAENFVLCSANFYILFWFFCANLILIFVLFFFFIFSLCRCGLFVLKNVYYVRYFHSTFQFYTLFFFFIFFCKLHFE